jgi:hypothetical protein
LQVVVGSIHSWVTLDYCSIYVPLKAKSIRGT